MGNMARSARRKQSFNPPKASAQKMRHRKASKRALEGEHVLLEWHVHLAREQPLRAAIAIIAIAFAITLGYAWLRSWLGAVVTGFVLICALSDFFFPVYYRLTSRGAEVRGFLSWHIIEWERVRACYLDNDGLGVRLSPFPYPTRLNAFRGVYLRFADNADEVLRIIKRKAKQRNKERAE